MAETLVSSAVLALASATVIFVVFIMSSQLLTSRRRAQMLEKLSQANSDNYLCFDSPKRIAWCFGLLKPKVFVSSGLLQTASKEQQQVILAHELARASRYDNLRKWLLNWATVAWPKQIRRHIRQDFMQLCDAICDLKAFIALNKSVELRTYFQTLKHFYAAQKPTTGDMRKVWQRRLETLQNELQSQKGKLSLNPQSLMLGTVTTLMGLVVVAVAVFVGHPLLEVLSYY